MIAPKIKSTIIPAISKNHQGGPKPLEKDGPKSFANILLSLQYFVYMVYVKIWLLFPF
ncbi:hypothetical protein EMIT07CA2_30441 [Brevibacillus sp. IT-7CA2]